MLTLVHLQEHVRVVAVEVAVFVVLVVVILVVVFVLVLLRLCIDEKELTCSSVVVANELLVADVDEDLNELLKGLILSLSHVKEIKVGKSVLEGIIPLPKKMVILQFSRNNPTPKKVYDKIQESRMGGILFKLNFLVLFSNAMGLSGKGGQYDSSDDDILEREFESKMDKLDQKVTLLKIIVEDLEFQFSNSLVDHPNSSRLKDIKAKYNGIIRNTDLSDFAYAIEDNSNHHENQYGNDFSETDYSLNINDMSGNYNDGECSHGVEELDKNFINETDEEIGEDSSEEEMTEEVNQKVIEADIVLQKSINDDIQNKEQNSIDEDFQKVSEVVCIVEKSRESNIQNEEQMFVKGTDEEKEEEILNQDVSVVNVLKVIAADSISKKSREDEFNGFNVKKESSFDFKILDTPKVDDKEKSAVRGFEDCLNKGLFRQVAEPDNSIRSFGNPF
ncbi:hypothetical protein Tco_1483441 [Tanacetum coccineum]